MRRERRKKLSILSLTKVEDTMTLNIGDLVNCSLKLK
jgi:hypothetical protein